MLASHAGGKISPSVRNVRPCALCLTQIQTHDLHVSFQQFEVLIHDQGVQRKVSDIFAVDLGNFRCVLSIS
jgi:hypothetical protein